MWSVEQCKNVWSVIRAENHKIGGKSGRNMIWAQVSDPVIWYDVLLYDVRSCGQIMASFSAVILTEKFKQETVDDNPAGIRWIKLVI